MCHNKNDKQIFHAFLFKIRNYSLKVINIQRHKAELNIILPSVNNFDIKKGFEYLLIIFIITPYYYTLQKLNCNLNFNYNYQ